MHAVRWLAAAGLMLMLSTARAQQSHPWLQQADADIARMMEVRTKLRAEHDSALTNNQPARAECFKRAETAVDTLIELSQSARHWLAIHLQEGTELDAEEERGRIKAAVLRAEQHLRQASRCSEESPLTPPRRRGVTRDALWLPSQPTTPVTPWRRHVIGGRVPCLRHDGLACLVVRAFGLPAEYDCIRFLQEHDITPLSGWDRSACATADDVCVVLARALGLVVGDDRPPAAYRTALREYGLAVEMKLPPGNAPISEQEVRELLATGFGR